MHEKVLLILKKACNGDKKNLKNEVINKKKNSRNHMKMQILVAFARKNLKVNMLKIRNILKLVTIVIIQVKIEVLHIAYVI